MNWFRKNVKCVPISPAGRKRISRIGLAGEQKYFAIGALLLHFKRHFYPRQRGHRYFGNEEVRRIIPSSLDSQKGLSEKAGVEAVIAQSITKLQAIRTSSSSTETRSSLPGRAMILVNPVIGTAYGPRVCVLPF